MFLQDIGGTQVLELRRQFEKSIMNNKFRTVKDRRHIWDNSTNVPIVDFNAFYSRLDKTISEYSAKLVVVSV